MLPEFYNACYVLGVFARVMPASIPKYPKMTSINITVGVLILMGLDCQTLPLPDNLLSFHPAGRGCIFCSASLSERNGASPDRRYAIQ
jgi:hypothetical protein